MKESDCQTVTHNQFDNKSKNSMQLFSDPENSTYSLSVGDTDVRVRFSGTESLNSRLAGAFSTMIG